MNQASWVALVVKNPPAGDTDSVLGLGRSPGGGHGNPLQCSCPWRIPWKEEPGRLQSSGSQSQPQLEQLRTHACRLRAKKRNDFPMGTTAHSLEYGCTFHIWNLATCREVGVYEIKSVLEQRQAILPYGKNCDFWSQVDRPKFECSFLSQVVGHTKLVYLISLTFSFLHQLNDDNSYLARLPGRSN